MTGGHTRNTVPMRTSPRRGPRTRDGSPCSAPAAHGKTRCRTHGLFAGETISEQRQVRMMLDEARKLLRELR